MATYNVWYIYILLFVTEIVHTYVEKSVSDLCQSVTVVQAPFLKISTQLDLVPMYVWHILPIWDLAGILE